MAQSRDWRGRFASGGGGGKGGVKRLGSSGKVAGAKAAGKPALKGGAKKTPLQKHDAKWKGVKLNSSNLGKYEASLGKAMGVSTRPAGRQSSLARIKGGVRYY